MTAFTSLLIDTITIWMPVRVNDGQGGFALSYANAGTVEGRIRPASSSERTVAMSEERQITHVLYTETLLTSGGSEFGRGSLAVVGDLIVEIQGVRNPSNMAHHYEIDCLERQQEIGMELGS
ncbi:MAG: head-tail adaptor protein [Anaerolineae bacterium]|nr:head-tail adaptor protein [Anaerolineae bacterium]